MPISQLLASGLKDSFMSAPTNQVPSVLTRQISSSSSAAKVLNIFSKSFHDKWLEWDYDKILDEVIYRTNYTFAHVPPSRTWKALFKKLNFKLFCRSPCISTQPLMFPDVSSCKENFLHNSNRVWFILSDLSVL